MLLTVASLTNQSGRNTGIPKQQKEIMLEGFDNRESHRSWVNIWTQLPNIKLGKNFSQDKVNAKQGSSKLNQL